MNTEQIGSLIINKDGTVLCGFKKGFHYRNFEACVSVLVLNKRDKFEQNADKKEYNEKYKNKPEYYHVMPY